ncbi:MAG: S1C family serine protease [Bacillota bacterium]
MRRHQLISAIVVIIAILCSSVTPAMDLLTATDTATTVQRVAAIVSPSVVGIVTLVDEEISSLGTGFVFHDGVIITNAHVVKDATEVKVLFPDRTLTSVKLTDIAADDISDIATIKVETKGLKPLAITKSGDLQVGTPVIAIGNPMGFRLGNTVTTGILSGIDRRLGSGYPSLQVDAAVNPGNSGGPLVNAKGEVIGLINSKMVDTSVEGLSFAIPSSVFTEIADVLVRNGKVERAVLGLFLEEGWEAYYGVPSDQGVEITHSIADGPMGTTAIQSGDRLISIDGQKMSLVDDVYSFLHTRKPGDEVLLGIKRDDRTFTIKVKLASYHDIKSEAETVDEEIEEQSGIMVNLTDSQIDEAADFGRKLADGWADLSDGYFDGKVDRAVLFTEYLYVARRVMSMTEQGFTVAKRFEREVAQQIRGSVEIQFELNGKQADFLEGAKVTLKQGERMIAGKLVTEVSYLVADDKTDYIACFDARFDSEALDPAEPIEVRVTPKSGEPFKFDFELNGLK